MLGMLVVWKVGGEELWKIENLMKEKSDVGDNMGNQRRGTNFVSHDKFLFFLVIHKSW